MSNLTDRIQALSPVQAASILQAIARSRLNRGDATALTPDTSLANALATEIGTTPTAGATEADVAKAALLLLAEDTPMVPILTSLIENPPATEMVDPGTLAIGVTALIILQSHIKIERDKKGQWSVKIEKKPLADSLLGQLISKLGGWLQK